MATKDEELALLAEGKGCLGRAAGDEPIFVLRAKDPAAATIVRMWAQLALSFAMHEPEKIQGAIELADRMVAWRSAHFAPYRWPQSGDE
jgi:hypothetical protein